MITAYQNGKYITRNTSHFKFTDTATDEEEQEDDDESTGGEQGTSVESQVLTRDLRCSEHGRKPFKHLSKHL